MKKTLIALLTLAGVAYAWDNSYTGTSFTLDGTTTENDRLIFDGSTSTGSSSIEVTTTADVIIGEINANSSSNITSVTFNLTGTLTVTGQTFMGKGNNFATTLNMGDSGQFITTSNAFSSGKITALTLNANLAAGVTDRVLVKASTFMNVSSITLNITSTDSFTYGGMLYVYNGDYYAGSDVTNSGGRLTIAAGAKTIDIDHLTEKKLYSVVTMKSMDSGNPVFNQISLRVIPEPATATLSLLALAGLAARRRRK